VPGYFLKGAGEMDDQQINKFIGYAIGIIIAYYILGFIVPFLIWGVVLMIVWRAYQEFQKHK
jgi:hypothetical protein